MSIAGRTPAGEYAGQGSTSSSRFLSNRVGPIQVRARSVGATSATLPAISRPRLWPIGIEPQDAERPASGRPDEIEAVDAVDCTSGGLRQSIRVQTDLRDATCPLLQHDRDLAPGKAGPRAAVNAVAEGAMNVTLAVEIDCQGILPVPLVQPVKAGWEHDHFPGAHGQARVLDIRSHPPCNGRNTMPPHDFLDGQGDLLGIFDKRT